MKRFIFFDHTGDMGVKVYGESLRALFRNAAEAFSQVITDPDMIREEESLDISLRANGLEELLVQWLNELLFLFETRGLLFKHLEIGELSDHHIRAMGRGETYKEERHPIKTLIKAVTYHQLYVKKEKGVWEARIIFDL